MDTTELPERYWHCRVSLTGERGYAVVNDLPLEELMRTVVTPWRAGRPFTVAGKVVRAAAGVAEIRIAHTSEPKAVHAERYNFETETRGISDWATDRSLLPLTRGTDFTFSLLFDGLDEPVPSSEVSIVEHVCRRLPQAARILAARSRTGHPAYLIGDEYDVQDLLHAMLRAYLKYSVQEDPLPKTAGTRSGRADISVEELGLLIEVKYVRSPADQKRIFDEYSQDLVLYASWPHLSTLIFLIYNSADLRDAEALEKLGGPQEVNGRRFAVRVILA